MNFRSFYTKVVNESALSEMALKSETPANNEEAFTAWLNKPSVTDSKVIELLFEADPKKDKWAYKVKGWKDVYFDKDKRRISSYITQEHQGKKIEWILPIEEFRNRLQESPKGDEPDES